MSLCSLDSWLPRKTLFFSLTHGLKKTVSQSIHKCCHYSWTWSPNKKLHCSQRLWLQINKLVFSHDSGLPRQISYWSHDSRLPRNILVCGHD